ncbi:MAG: L,D-transpeptidase family protein [Mesorhizobium sp.]
MIVVRRKPGNPSQGLLVFDGRVFRCALGKGGTSSRKREGDGATPIASMRLLSGYFRRDGVVARRTNLPLAPIHARLGWCDAPADRNYNRPVTLPYAASHETMRRKDRLYDICIVLDWNITPRHRGGGSAIFMHLARPGYLPTEGCVALALRDMARLLPHLSRHTVVKVVG